MARTIRRTHVAARRLGGALGVLAALLGVVGLAGWLFDQPLLRTVFSGYASMKANTAAGMIVSGFALIVAGALPNGGISIRALRCGAAALVAALGAVSMIEHLAHVDLGIDQWLAADPFTPVEFGPGRMSRATATGFIVFGFAVLFSFRAPTWSFWVGFTLTAIGFWTSLVTCVGYMFDAQTIYSAVWFSNVAIHTAFGFLALFAGMMLAIPDRGWARIVLTNKLGGVVARRLLPLMAVVPLAVLWLAHEGADAGFYSASMGHYIGTVALLVILTTVVLVMCGRLNVLDAHRRLMHEGRQRAQSAAVRLRQIAEKDPLTDLWNRRHFLAEAEAQIAAALGDRSPLAVLMIDADHFKRINDMHGHAGGDQALRLIAATMKDVTRRDDCVARMGGEEFAVLLPGATRAVAESIAGRICEQVARLVLLDGQGRRFGVTASIGLAVMVPEDRKPEDLLARADAALYEAKRTGRNRVVVNSPDLAAA
ncbi:MAG: GGDEF domain-containing protein [Rhodospirillaceae bacterium]|nr:GGDEF domain-containing protein [Rhodospirillaceae bacterium]